MNKCKYCNSENLILENRSKLDIMQAPQVALICGDCGKFVKWCPKAERQLYIENHPTIYKELCRLEGYERWADAEITDLNKQLAESEKMVDKWSTEYNQATSLVDTLNQQLAEKEKQILTQKKNLAFFYDVFNNPKGKQTLETINQDKLDFAITELEKVNSVLTDTIIEVTEDEWDLNKLYYLEPISAKFGQKIEQQINELKGELNGESNRRSEKS